MKKLFTLLLTLAMVLSLAACGGGKDTPDTGSDANNAGSGTSGTSGDTDTNSGTQDGSEKEIDFSALSMEELKAMVEELKPQLQTVTEGKLTVATSPDFAPYEFYAIDENGTPVLAGFDLALINYIADFLGLEADVNPMDFDGVLMEVNNKTVDLGVAGLSPDPDRANIMDFSNLYYIGGQSFVTVKGKEDQFPNLEATNDPKYQIGAQTGSIQVTLMQTNSPNAQQIQLSKVPDILMELISGKLDGAYIETAVAECYAKNYHELAIILDVPYDVAGSAIGVQKDNPVLLQAVNAAIAAALQDGSMADFVAEANELATGEVYEGLLDEQGRPQG